MDIANLTPEQWYEKENDWLEAVKNATVWNQIPLLNVNELHNFKNAQLVKFRGMVQDMHGPEFYMEKYELLNEDTGESCMKVGKYIDISDCKPNETINFESLHTVRNERQNMVVISIPAINRWVQQIEEKKFKLTTETATTTQDVQTKRPLEEMDVDQEPESQSESNSNVNKRQCTNVPKTETAKQSISPEALLNFPIPNSSGKVCHLKVYNNSELLKLNSVCEFVGFLSLHPALSTAEVDECMDEIEFQVHNPPPSLIPRIHCTAFKFLTHSNPLVDEESMTPERMQYIKKELLILFTQLLLGDELAAEYLIYHLISEVYLRKDLMAIGKFSLNISNVPKFENHDYVQELYKFIELLIPKSYYLPLTLDNMNSLAFIPKKDYNSNRLTSSILQLSSNTHLVLDETKMSTGKLNEAGVKGIRAIANVIKNQTALYEFTYYQMEFDCNIPLLIFSEGKSMLPSDILIRLQPDESHLSTFTEILEAARHFLKPELLNEIRIYLTLARLTKYELTDEIQELVQNEYVKMRQNSSVTGEDLHSLLVLARLVCISQGKKTLDAECWKRACELEETRKNRLKTNV